jgi:hypothetical protein
VNDYLDHLLRQAPETAAKAKELAKEISKEVDEYDEYDDDYEDYTDVIEKKNLLQLRA